MVPLSDLRCGSIGSQGGIASHSHFVIMVLLNLLVFFVSFRLSDSESIRSLNKGGGGNKEQEPSMVSSS